MAISISSGERVEPRSSAALARLFEIEPASAGGTRLRQVPGQTAIFSLRNLFSLRTVYLSERVMRRAG